MPSFRTVLAVGSTAIALWYAVGFAYALSGRGMPTDIGATLDGEDGVLFVAGSTVKRLDLTTGRVETVVKLDRAVLHVLRDGAGRLVFEARTATPKGRPTIQPFVEEGGRLVPLLPRDESMRKGLSMVEGVPTYVKQTEWRGAFGGTPWGGEGQLCQVVDGREETIAAPLRRTAEAGSTTHGTTLPVSYYAETGNGPYALALVDTRTGKVREIGRFASVSNPALLPDGSRVAFSQSLHAVVEVDATTGRTLAEHPVDGRVIGVMVAPSGTLYALTGEANSGEAELLEVKGDRFEHVATLR